MALKRSEFMFNFVKKDVPYTTITGIHIGLLYEQPSYYFPDEDAILVQQALLKIDIPSKLSRFKAYVSEKIWIIH
jgi:hypothetical protein